MRWRVRVRPVRRADLGASVGLLLACVGAHGGNSPVVVRAGCARRRRCACGAPGRLPLGLRAMSELGGLDAVTEAVESGAGLPEVVRAASRALDASLAVTDAAGATIAVAAR